VGGGVSPMMSLVGILLSSAQGWMKGERLVCVQLQIRLTSKWAKRYGTIPPLKSNIGVSLWQRVKGWTRPFYIRQGLNDSPPRKWRITIVRYVRNISTVSYVSSCLFEEWVCICTCILCLYIYDSGEDTYGDRNRDLACWVSTLP